MNKPMKKKEIKTHKKIQKMILGCLFVFSFILLLLFGDFSTFLLLQIAGFGGCYFYDRF